MSTRTDDQSAALAPAPCADDSAPRSTLGEASSGAGETREARVPRLKLTRIPLDRKLSPYFAT